MSKLPLVDRVQRLWESHTQEGLSSDDFLIELKELHEHSQARSKKLLDHCQNKDFRTCFPQEVQLVEHGIRIVEEGFQRWFDYARQGGNQALAEGLELIQTGNQYMRVANDSINLHSAPYNWGQHYAAELAIPELAELHTFFQSVNTYRIHHQGRDDMPENQQSQLVYGNTWPPTCYRLLKLCQVGPTDHFVDLGCGCGMPVFTARLLVGSALGVDIVPTVIDFCNQVLSERPDSHIEFRVQDIFETDLSKATVIFTDLTVFPDEIKARLQDKLLEAPPQAKIITATHPLDESRYRLVEKFTLPCNWAGTGPQTSMVPFHLQMRA